MASFTLDTNCLLALHNQEPEAAQVQRLIDAQAAGVADVAAVAISASERQRGGALIQNFDEFRERLKSFGCADLKILPPMLYFDITFWDWSLFASEEMQALERCIHDVLFPQIPFLWQDYCRQENIDPGILLPSDRWRNSKCDVLAMWTHIYNRRDIFVTNDSNFHGANRKSALIELGAKQIERPADAVLFL